jgi:hypothetical protein
MSAIVESFTFSIHQKMAKSVSKVEFWLDSGFNSAADCGRVKQDRDTLCRKSSHSLRGAGRILTAGFEGPEA